MDELLAIHSAVDAVKMLKNAENAIKDEIDRGGIKKITPELISSVALIASINYLSEIIDRNVAPELARITEVIDVLGRK